MTHRARILMIVVVAAAAAGAWWWWSQPTRQIRAILGDVATALTSEPGESSLETLGAAAALERHLAEDVVVERRDGESIAGRDAVITAAARARAQRPRRLRFFDPRITLVGDGEATVVITAEAITQSAAGNGEVEVYEVMATLRRADGRWLVSTARMTTRSPQSRADARDGGIPHTESRDRSEAVVHVDAGVWRHA